MVSVRVKISPSRGEENNRRLEPPPREPCRYRLMESEGATPGMNPWNLFAGGAALGLVAGLWDKFKAIAWRAMNLFVQQIEIPTEAAHEAVIAHLIANYKRSRAYDRMYGATYEHQRDGRYGLIPYEVFGHRTIIFWNRLFPFFFANAVEKK